MRKASGNNEKNPNRTQRTVSTDDLSYKGKNYPLRTFLIPFTEAEVNAPARFDSDFLVEYIKKKKIKFSPEAKEVLSEAKALWKQYFSEKDPKRFEISIIFTERMSAGFKYVKP